MEYNKGGGGAWVPADKLINGLKVKLVSECVKQESHFKNKDGEPKTENVAKVRLQGGPADIQHPAQLGGCVRAHRCIRQREQGVG